MAHQRKLPGPAVRREGLLTAVGLGLVVLVVFGGTLDNGFVYDDPHVVERGPQVRTLDPAAHLASAFWAGSTPRFPYYRPAATWSLALDRALFNEGPVGFHRTNLLLHALNAWLVFWILRRFASVRVAVVAAVLFAIHPVQTETVAWIVARADLLTTTFVLLGTGLFVNLPDRPGLRDSPSFVLAFTCLGFALLSKESAVAFPAVLFGADLARRRTAGDDWSVAIGALVRRWWVYGPVCLALVGGYLALRYSVTGALIGTTQASVAETEALWKNPLLDVGRRTRWLTATTIAGRYLLLLVFPWRLSIDYFFDVVPLVRSPMAPAFWMSVASVVAAFVAAVAAARRWPAAAFGCFTAVGGWLLVSHIFFAAPIVMAERALYLPLVGFAAIGASVAVAATDRLPRAVALGLTVILMALLGWRSFDRVADWRDNRSLFAAATRDTPRSATAWNNLGAAQRADGDLADAAESFTRAATVAPHYLRARLNEARARLAIGRLDEAERLFRETAGDFPRQEDMVLLELVQVHERQAQALYAAGNVAEAQRAFAQITEEAGLLAETTENPQAEAGFLLVVARAAAAAGRPDVAEEGFSRALKVTVLAEDLVNLRIVVLEELARFFIATDRTVEAAETFDLAATTAAEIDQPATAVRLHLRAAEIFRAAGDKARASRSHANAKDAANGDPLLLERVDRTGT